MQATAFGTATTVDTGGQECKSGNEPVGELYSVFCTRIPVPTNPPTNPPKALCILYEDSDSYSRMVRGRRQCMMRDERGAKNASLFSADENGPHFENGHHLIMTVNSHTVFPRICMKYQNI